MAIVSRTDSFVAPTLTEQSLFDAIKQAFSNAGFTSAFDEYTSGTDKIVVYAFVQDATKTYGTTYLRIRLTAGFVIGQQLYSTWNAGTHTGTNGSTEVAYTALPTNVQVNFTALNGGSEYRLVMLTQGATAIALGCFFPANRPSWWNLNAWNYAFIPTANTFAMLRSTALNPYSNAECNTSHDLRKCHLNGGIFELLNQVI